MRKNRRLIALILAVLLLVTVVPVDVLAADDSMQMSEEQDIIISDGEDTQEGENSEKELSEYVEEDFNCTASAELFATASSGIKGNGTSGIYIDINSAPYTTFASKAYGEYAYGTEGCAWFASARANQLTGIGNTIYSGWAWWNTQYNTFGYGKGSEPRAKALACYSNHVAVVEAVNGDTITVSEGGMSGSSSSEYGYCVISTMSRSKLESDRGTGEFYGYVYLNATTGFSVDLEEGAVLSGTAFPVSGSAWSGNNNPKLHLYMDYGWVADTSYGSDGRYTFYMDTTQFSNGKHLLGVKLTNDDGYDYTWWVNIVINNTGSIYTVDSIQEGSILSGTRFPITGYVYEGGTYPWLYLYMDYDLVAGTANNSEGLYAFYLDTTQYSEGKHLLGVKITNNEGLDYTAWFNVYIDNQEPDISEVSLDMDEDGYTVTCKVQDEGGIDRVQFPTWTLDGGQDDLFEDWRTNSFYTGTMDGDTVTFRVNISDYNNDRGLYKTHIYAFDKAGNVSAYGDIGEIKMEEDSPVNYKITYHLDGGVNDPRNPATYSSANPYVSFNYPTKTGYSFAGWYTEKTGGTKVTEETKLVGDVDLYAHWYHRGYWVTFDSNGGETPSVESKIVGYELTYGTLPSVIREGYQFMGWYTAAEGGSLVTKDTLMTTLNAHTLYAHWEKIESSEGLWITEIPEQSYNGNKIIPDVQVYDGETLLTENVDYKLSYKNNIKANDASVQKTAPTVTVTGKGNYSGTETAFFKILPKEISDEDITIADITVKESAKVQKPVPVITWNGKKLKNKTDFMVEYPDTIEGAYREEGNYDIVITGKGNYTGSVTVNMAITSNNLMAKTTVSKVASQKYTGEEIEPEITVKYGKTVLEENTDYSVSYQNNTEIGTATVILTGMGDYSGEKIITFKIYGDSISKAKVYGLEPSVEYTGDVITQDCMLTLKINGETEELIEDEDYTVTYEKNEKAGTAKVTFTGINRCSGVLKKSFRIVPFNMSADMDGQIEITLDDEIAYAKGGSKPKPEVTFQGRLLTEGIDYKLSYQNNGAVNDGSNPKRLPTVKVTGKGNFKGSQSVNFAIEKQDISRLTLSAPDVVFKNKPNAWRSSVSIIDLDGKKLSAGKDYEKNTITYTYAEDTTLLDGSTRKAGRAIASTDILPAGTVIEVTAEGAGCYTGTVSGRYRVVSASISNAKVKVETQIYTGEEICPGRDEITVTVGGVTLCEEDYEIVSYSNNVKKGSASVMLKGVGNYGGTKTVKFTIKSKGLLWWWR